MDLNGDGHRDVITGCWPKKLYIFAGDGDGGYRAPTPILDKDGKPIMPGSASTVFAADWDEDGDLDLITGNIDGQIQLASNEGTRQKPRFTELRRLTTTAGLIRLPNGDSTPCVADWDGDGRLDILSGSGAGSVHWFRNTGTKGKPRLAPGVTLAAAKFKVAVHSSAGCGLQHPAVCRSPGSPFRYRPDCQPVAPGWSVRVA